MIEEKFTLLSLLNHLSQENITQVCHQWVAPNLKLRFISQRANSDETRMWADAQRDGRPAKYRWRPVFNAAKFGWRPLLECRAETLPKCESGWNLQGCPKLANRYQPLVGRSSPYYEDMWRRYGCLTRFFPIVDTCVSSEDTGRQSCAMVPKWRFFASCIFIEPRTAHFRHAFYIRTKATPSVEVW